VKLEINGPLNKSCTTTFTCTFEILSLDKFKVLGTDFPFTISNLFATKGKEVINIPPGPNVATACLLSVGAV
jgi:hypothetical protein